MTIEFEWNERKASTNRAKHQVSFEEASTVFADPLSLTSPDPEHSVGESRYVTIGQETSGKLVVVAHTDGEGVIRILSARRATRREVIQYEEF